MHMHYGQIEWGQDAFSRTNPSQRNNLNGDSMCEYTQRINVLGHEMYLWRYDIYTKGEWSGQVVYICICVLLNIVSEQQSCVCGGRGVAERRRDVSGC